MAYLCLLASVDEQQVADYQQQKRSALVLSRQTNCSHLIAYWVTVQPLGELLGQAVDGGEPLRSDLWHPLIMPMLHRPRAVQRLQQQLADAWENALKDLGPVEPGDWYVEQITNVLDIFEHAGSRGECVVRFLEAPYDAERASRVVIPLAKPKQE